MQQGVATVTGYVCSVTWLFERVILVIAVFGSVTEAQLAIVVHNSCHVKFKSIRSITKANARINFQRLSSYSKSSHQISNTHTKFKSLYGQSSQII